MATPEESASVKFKIGDDEYEIPPIDDFDMDEWQLVYEYAGLVLEDFAPCDDAAVMEGEEKVGEDGPDEKARQRLVGQPAFMRSLLHIGYRRAHPELKDAEIRAVTGTAKLTRLFEDAVEDDAGPPEVTDTSPASSAPANSRSSNGVESAGSAKSSDVPGSRRAPTGTPG